MALPAGYTDPSYSGGQVLGPNGQPATINGQPVYYVNGQYYGPNDAPYSAAQIAALGTNQSAGMPSAMPNNVIAPTPTYLPPPTITQPTMPTGPGGTYLPPEVAALQQIGQIDPTTLALSEQLGPEYAALGPEYFSNINNVANLSNKLQASYLQDFRNANAGQLPPGVQREVQQQVAAQEAGTGNTAGVAQAVQQGMTTGETGYGYKQQAASNLGNFMGANYLGNVLNQATNYLGATSNYVAGPSTPYALGTGYVNNAINQSSAAMSGGQVPTYNPYSQGAAPFSYINPGAGNEFAQGTTGFLNAGVGATPGSPNTLAPLLGAGIGAAGSATSALISSGALGGLAAGLGGALAAF